MWDAVFVEVRKALGLVRKFDNTLAPYFSWAGRGFPFCDDAADITISGATTWNDAAGFKRAGKLTIAAGVTLTIAKTPFYIFAREIAFGGTTSTITASGYNGSVDNNTSFSARGGGSHSNVRGGDGGGMLFIVCDTISGANGRIWANGGNGYGTSGGPEMGGQGAFSASFNLYAGAQERWSGEYVVTTTSSKTYLHPLGVLLVAGGDDAVAQFAGTGGGSGAGLGGGSGIGGGGSGYSSSGTNVGRAAKSLTPLLLITLAQSGCRGGGGGGGRPDGSGGGGGGSVCVWARTLTSTPVLTANGGTPSNSGAAGGAGVTHLITV